MKYPGWMLAAALAAPAHAQQAPEVPATAASAASTPAAPAPACTIVLGQGRNAAEADGDANELWDRVNLAFNSEVAARLKDRGVRVVAIVLRVTATDLAGNVRKLLARAAAERCDGIVETTLFADYAAHTLVARIRDYPIVSDAAGALAVGEPRYVVERNFELSRSTFDRVRPAALGAEMTAELVERTKR